MHSGNLVFTQLMEFAPWHTFRRLVAKYRGDFNVRTFSCVDQFLSMAFAQLTWRESLRDIEACLTSAPANSITWVCATRQAQHAGRCAGRARLAHLRRTGPRPDRPRGGFTRPSRWLWILQTIYALDASIIDLCLQVYPWARFDAHRGPQAAHPTGTARAFPAQMLVV